MKIEANEIFAIFIVLMLPLGIGQFVAKATLPEYGAALQIRGALAGAAAEPHIVLAAALERVYASAMGMDAASNQAIVGFLLLFPPLAFALTSALLYLACRQLSYGKAQSAFAALLFSLSLAATLSFLPGVYGSSQIAALCFAAFMTAFVVYVQTPARVMALLPAALFALCAGFLNAAFALAGVAMVASFAFAHHKKAEKNYLAMLGALALVFIAAGALSPDKALLAFSADKLGQIATGAPFLFSAAAICLGLFFFGTKDSEYLSLVLLGAALFGFSPLAGALLLVLAAAEGVSKVVGKISKEAMLAGAFAGAFFVIFGLTYSSAGIYPALASGALIGLLAPLMLHFYDYNARGFFATLGASLLLLSLFFALFIQLAPARQGFPQYTDDGLAGALSYLASSNANSLATLERSDAVGFYLPNAQLEGNSSVQEFLSSGRARPASGTLLLLSLSSLETLSNNGGFEVYYYSQNYTNSGVTYALFVSQSGRLIAREIGIDGKAALKDGAALDSFGRYYAPIALTRMAMLNDELPNSDKENRMLLLEEGGVPPKVVDIYSGRYAGVALVKEFAKVALYKVN